MYNLVIGLYTSAFNHGRNHSRQAATHPAGVGQAVIAPDFFRLACIPISGNSRAGSPRRTARFAGSSS
jgi:hypothetical protein